MKDHRHPNCPLDQLEALRESEINFSIATFFDAGWDFTLGDSMNGVRAVMNFTDFYDGVTWLWQTAEKHFPEAECFL